MNCLTAPCTNLGILQLSAVILRSVQHGISDFCYRIESARSGTSFIPQPYGPFEMNAPDMTGVKRRYREYLNRKVRVKRSTTALG